MIIHAMQEIQGQSKALWTVSTLLIPQRYLSYYKKECRNHGSRAKYLRYLLCAYGPLVKSYQIRMAEMKDDK